MKDEGGRTMGEGGRHRKNNDECQPMDDRHPLRAADLLGALGELQEG
jgi:hypothetical protein